MTDHTKEIAAGQVVRGYVLENENLAETILTEETWTLASKPHGIFTQPVLLILPPKPLEVTGFMCDRLPPERLVCFGFNYCLYPEQEDSCKGVTLVEKGACQCQK